MKLGNVLELSPRMLPCGVMWFDEASDSKFPHIAQIIRQRFENAMKVAPCGKWFVAF
jgi:hypothetical protein